MLELQTSHPAVFAGLSSAVPGLLKQVGLFHAAEQAGGVGITAPLVLEELIARGGVVMARSHSYVRSAVIDLQLCYCQPSNLLPWPLFPDVEQFLKIVPS